MTRFPLKRALLALAVAVALIAGVASLALRQRGDPTYARVHADFATLLDTLERYRASGRPLPEEGTLDFLVPDYLPQVPVDPWGRPYEYAHNGRQPLLVSLGQDGVRGGHGADQDHTNHDGHPAPAPAR